MGLGNYDMHNENALNANIKFPLRGFYFIYITTNLPLPVWCERAKSGRSLLLDVSYCEEYKSE